MPGHNPLEKETADLLERLDDCIARDREARGAVDDARQALEKAEAMLQSARQAVKGRRETLNEAETRARRTSEGIQAALKAIQDQRGG